MDLFLPAAERREILRGYGRDHALNYFIETGTSTGDTPWALKSEFKRLFTIELDETLYWQAVRRFRHNGGDLTITCLQGDSTVVLPKVLDEIKEPALVWLDGHYCGPGSAHGAISTPVAEELEILFRDNRPHVILVDDARIFEGGPEHDLYPHYADYPSLTWVQGLAEQNGYAYELRDDIIRLTPRMALWDDAACD